MTVATELVIRDRIASEKAALDRSLGLLHAEIKDSFDVRRLVAEHKGVVFTAGAVLLILAIRQLRRPSPLERAVYAVEGALSRLGNARPRRPAVIPAVLVPVATGMVRLAGQAWAQRLARQNKRTNTGER